MVPIRAMHAACSCQIYHWMSVGQGHANGVQVGPWKGTRCWDVSLDGQACPQLAAWNLPCRRARTFRGSRGAKLTFHNAQLLTCVAHTVCAARSPPRGGARNGAVHAWAQRRCGAGQTGATYGPRNQVSAYFKPSSLSFVCSRPVSTPLLVYPISVSPAGGPGAMARRQQVDEVAPFVIKT